MPELTKHTIWICASNTSWSYQVPSSKGTGAYTVSFGPTSRGPYIYGYSCSCPAFLWRYESSKGEYTCKHIKAVMDFRCGWMGDVGEAGKLLPDGSRVCPKCGGPLVCATVGV